MKHLVRVGLTDLLGHMPPPGLLCEVLVLPLTVVNIVHTTSTGNYGITGQRRGTGVAALGLSRTVGRMLPRHHLGSAVQVAVEQRELVGIRTTLDL